MAVKTITGWYRGPAPKRFMKQMLNSDEAEVARSVMGRCTNGYLAISKTGGAPALNLDLASRDGDLCYDQANTRLYVASNVSTTTTTWTHISGEGEL